jgi:hypothetical protein
MGATEVYSDLQHIHLNGNKTEKNYKFTSGKKIVTQRASNNLTRCNGIVCRSACVKILYFKVVWSDSIFIKVHSPASVKGDKIKEKCINGFT